MGSSRSGPQQAGREAAAPRHAAAARAAPTRPLTAPRAAPLPPPPKGMPVSKESYLHALDEGIPLPVMAGLDADASAPGAAANSGGGGGGTLGGAGAAAGTLGGAAPSGGGYGGAPGAALGSSGGFAGGAAFPPSARGSGPGSPRRVRKRGVKGRAVLPFYLSSARGWPLFPPCCTPAPRTLPRPPPQLDPSDSNRRSLGRGSSRKIPGRVVTSVVDGLKAIYFQKVRRP
jgi:hypothetical protein